MKISFALVTFVLLNISSCDDNPVDNQPENRSPVIFSLTVFPKIVKPNDSLIVICNVIDPDGDTLVYDWYTTGVVRIKGLHSWDCCALYNSYENSQIFYAPDSQFVSAPQDTFRIECAVRDGKGGGDVKLINFIVKQE
jgi:hypothetical protein